MEQAAASTAFSASSPERETRPRTRRGKAFSSRSIASMPAASSSVMNISETLAASATANESSDVRSPSSDLADTLIGSPTTFSTSSEKDRFSRARSVKSITRSTCAALRRVRRQLARARP